ncbi:MAG: YidC/Oxa1 family membrane protein insertase [Candidatus Gribaldobacteria bacterium]|nr:YidC/Oxa1 family membrane protein insertase [Candidatus Gribaldobacteria bacterium]
MNFLIQFYHLILLQPLLNGLVLIYVFLPGHDLGVAVIAITLIIRLLLHPLAIKGLRSQKKMAVLQPKMKEIQEKFKADKAQQSKAMMDLYREEKISPLSGCLPLLLQLPIIIALYQVFSRGLAPDFLAANLYSFTPNPGVMNQIFLGVFDLHNKSFILVVALLAGVAQFWQAKTSGSFGNTPAGGDKNDFTGLMQKQILYVFPIITLIFVYRLGGVIGIYWLFSTLFSVGEQYLVNRKFRGGADLPRTGLKF